jgi:hypothetical protein
MLSFLPPNFSAPGGELGDVEIEDFREQAEDEDVLALVLGVPPSASTVRPVMGMPTP